MTAALYSESGTLAIVSVLSDETVTRNGGTFREVRVRAVKVLRASTLCPVATGQELSLSVNLKYPAHAGWRIDYDVGAIEELEGM